MDITATDTRVKLLMRSENLAYEEAVHLLKVCNWDVSKAQSIVAQRKLRELSSFPGAEQTTKHPVTVPGQGAAKPRAEKMEPCSNYNSVNTQSLPKSADVPAFQDESTPIPRLQRGMSNAFINSKIVTMARDILQKDAEAAMVAERGEDEDGKSFVQTTEFTFMLPDLSCYPEDFKAFLYKDLIDTATLVSLEQAGHLNWWADFGACQRLLPMVTSGDGNCLLHAASLGMWGLHDRQLILRKLLWDALTNGASADAFKRRWRYQQSTIYRQCNLVLSEEEWESDWRLLLQLSSPQPRSTGSKQSNSVPRFERSFAGQLQETEVVYESLEEMHVFVLAHILRRPIVVVAKAVLQDVHGDALAPIPFGGIYLPLEFDARQCHSTPLLLTYDLSHFCALVAMEVSPRASQEFSTAPLAEAIPLVSLQLELLPVHFAIDPGPHYDFSKNLDLSLSHHEKMNHIQNYFIIEQIPVSHLQRELDSCPEGFGTVGIIKAELTKSDSEESGGSAKDRNYSDDFDRKSIPKPMKFITKSFDTLGSKLKNIAKSSRPGKFDRRGSFGMATQSTRASSVAVEMFESQSFLVCARLRHRKTGYQDIMVRNYIDSMREKFDAQKIKRQEQNAEIRRRSIERFNLRTNNATLRAEIGRLDLDLAEMSGNQRHSSVLPGSNTGSLLRQDTVVTAGKSKFYTTATEEQFPNVDPFVESKRPDDTFKSDRVIRNPVSEKGTLKYNKLGTMQLDAGQDVTLIRQTQLTKKDDLSDRDTLSRQGAKVGESEFGVPRRLNAKPKRLISDRHTVDGNNVNVVSKPPPENRVTRYVTNSATSAQNPQEVKNSSLASGDLNRELNRDFDVGKTQQLLCRAGDCPFYGTYETGFLCSQCFKSGKKPRLCQVANCQNEGDPSRDNLCKLCFQQKSYSFQVQYPTAQTKF